jgi:dephospho-CoA kinase
MNGNPRLIGITGNIGGGKSTFSQLLAKKGYTVVLADEIARQQLDDPDSLKMICRRWGADVVTKGKADRVKIAKIVFNNKLELDYLNSITHPKTLAALQLIADSHTERHVFFEIPLLFEAGLQQCFDFIILIRADKEVRLNRLLKAENSDPFDILARMEAQIDDLGKIPLCDLVIENNGPVKNLEKNLSTFIEHLDEIKQKSKMPFSS